MTALEHYVAPPDMSFAKSDALFPKDESLETDREFEKQCRILCFGKFPHGIWFVNVLMKFVNYFKTPEDLMLNFVLTPVCAVPCCHMASLLRKKVAIFQRIIKLLVTVLLF